MIKFKKTYITLGLILCSFATQAQMITFDEKQQEALDRLTSGAAARYTIAVTCKENQPHVLWGQLQQRLAQRALNLGYEKNETIDYIKVSVERKLKAFGIAYQDKECSHTHNLKTLAVHYGFWD